MRDATVLPFVNRATVTDEVHSLGGRDAFADIREVRRLLVERDIRAALRLLVATKFLHAIEIMSLVRADLVDEALARLDLFLSPKFASLAACTAALEEGRLAA